MKIFATFTPSFLSVVLLASPAYAFNCIFDEDCPGKRGPDFVACCCANKCESVCPCSNNCLFSINYSEDGCEEAKSAVGLNAYLQNEPYTVSAKQQLPCAEAMMCRMDAENNQDMCPEDQMKEIALQLDLDENTGNIISVLSNFTVGPDVCMGGPSNQGVEESWFDCYFSYWTLDNLKDQPEVLANDNPDDLLMMQKYSYLVYYEDDACTDLASIIPSVNGKTLNIPSVSNTELSCNRQAMCAIDPNSAVCEAVRDADAENAQITLETRLDETTGEVNVYECDSSNVAAGEEECALQTPSDCGKSSIYSNCYFRYLSGPTLALNPRFLVGEVDREDDVGGGSEMETPSNSTDTEMGDADGIGPGGVIEQLGACVVPSDLGKDIIDTECIQAVLSSLDPTVIEQLAECAGLGSFVDMQACVEEQLSDAATAPPVSDPTEPPTSSASRSFIIAGYTFVAIVYAAVLCIY